MTWNYRICQDEDGFSIHEVYYYDDGTIRSWTVDSVEASGESKEELIEDLVRMLVAVGRSVVDLKKEEKKLKST